MQLGFVSAILPDLELEQVLAFAAEAGYQTVELMCWPAGKAERRYAGVTHVDVANFSGEDAAQVNRLCTEYGVSVSGLGYYPNPLCPDEREAGVYIDHIKKVIDAAVLLGVSRMNTFAGRDPAQNLEANWGLFDERWPGIVEHAEAAGVNVGIENCPMLFSGDEWPGGQNMAYAPAIWRQMFDKIPSANFGLNYDPSHLVWQQIDHVRPIAEFADRIHHVHLKDAKVNRSQLDDVGILALPLEYHSPKLPGLGDVRWGPFFSALTDIGYAGPCCVEVEDRAYEDTLETRKQALLQSRSYLGQYFPAAWPRSEGPAVYRSYQR